MDYSPNSDNGFSASEARLRGMVVEAGRHCAAFRSALCSDADFRVAAELASQFCVATKTLQLSLPSFATAYDDAYSEMLSLLAEFVAEGSNFLSRTKTATDDIASIQTSVEECTARWEWVQHRLDVKERYQSILWQINGKPGFPTTVIGPRGELNPTPNDDFKLLEPIESGYYGVVWKSLQISLRRTVAIKIIHPLMQLRSNALEHARALARLNHRNVVTVYTVTKVLDPETRSVTDGIVMELLDGPDLESRMASERFPEEEAFAIAVQILNAVEAMHGAGMTHGDLHAGNVVITYEGVKLIDIKYSDSQTLAMLTGGSKQSRMQDDLNALSRLILRVISHSHIDLREINSFESALRHADSLLEIRSALRSRQIV